MVPKVLRVVTMALIVLSLGADPNLVLAAPPKVDPTTNVSWRHDGTGRFLNITPPDEWASEKTFDGEVVCT